MPAWRPHVSAFALLLSAAALGAFLLMLGWAFPDREPYEPVLGSPTGIVLAFAVLGAAAQRWFSPRETAGLAMAVLAGYAVMHLGSTEGDLENEGHSAWSLAATLLVVAGALVLTLLSHWVTGAVRGRAKRAEPDVA